MGRPRQVKATGKGAEGGITSLTGAFGTVSKEEAIAQIESGKASYKVGGSKVHLVRGQGGKYLRSTPDGKSGNNLANLPEA